MAKRITALTALLLAGSLMPTAQATTTHKSTPSSKGAAHHATASAGSSHSTISDKRAGKKTRGQKKLHGQQAIDSERVTEIQQALIKAHYFTGEADGNWDTHTVSAMQKFQADNNWQTKLMPDARALVKLGLGPDYSNAINAKGASFSTLPSTPTDPVSQQSSGFVSASGISR
jgi:peptidoglycan hydrolase-like protein with peptidoglycan-binding domain